MVFLISRDFMFLTLLFFLNFFSLCQSNSSQNIETAFYSLPPSSTTASFAPSDTPAPQPPSPPPWPNLSSKKAVATAAGVTSASTLFGAAFLLCLCNKCAGHKKREGSGDDSTTVTAVSGAGARGLQTVAETELAQVDENATSLPPPPPPPPPPLPIAKKGPAPPPLPPRGGGALASSQLPPAPRRSPNRNAAGSESEDAIDQVKLKPLHWEKVNTKNRGHSMVWDKLEHGSFQYNDDMIEALFGNTHTETKTAHNPDAKIFILDPRRSQNIAIVIRSFGGISIRELIDGLVEGKGLDVEILEKLTRMAPTKEEKINILAFDDPTGKLADAECFLYRVLKDVPTAFTRVNAMLFRHTYDSEIQQLQNTLQILDYACTELHSRGVFLKLLEATLKAGNRLNAGTARGDAKAFNLTALHKLSDYKSSDGKTTLLHFVVHEVVRNEGRRCVMKQNNSQEKQSSNTKLELKSEEGEIIRNEGSQCNDQENSSSETTSVELKSIDDEVLENEGNLRNSQSSEATAAGLKSKQDQENEFLKLGLPIIERLSSEFSNVKKAATFDYDTLSNIGTSLGDHIAETSQLVLECAAESGQGEFIEEMSEFLEGAVAEIKAVQEEQTRVMGLIKKTSEYYQSGGFKDNQPLQLFGIIKDFLAMVDKACVDIGRSLQKKKPKATGVGGLAASSAPTLSLTRDVSCTPVIFPELPDHFLSETSNASNSDDDF